MSKPIEYRVNCIYKNLYPNKRGKSRGMRRILHSLTNARISTDKDVNDFEKAIIAYIEDCRKNPWRRFKQFDTFTSEWRDWIPEEANLQRDLFDKIKPQEQEIVPKPEPTQEEIEASKKAVVQLLTELGLK